MQMPSNSNNNNNIHNNDNNNCWPNVEKKSAKCLAGCTMQQSKQNKTIQKQKHYE